MIIDLRKHLLKIRFDMGQKDSMEENALIQRFELIRYQTLRSTEDVNSYNL